MRRTPHTKIHDRTSMAFFQELLAVRTQTPHARDEVLPCLGQASRFKVIHTGGMMQGGTEPEKTVVTDDKTYVARSAVKNAVMPDGD